MIFSNDNAIYLQMADRLCDEILSGKYGDDDRIPSVREYAVLLQVNTNTAVKAYEELAREEIIYIKRGMGYFVTPGAKKQILKVRRKEFMEQTMPELRRRMQLLGISIDDIVKENEQTLSALRSGIAQSTAAQVQAAREDQKAKDEQEAIAATQQLIDDIKAKQEASYQKLTQDISEFVDTVINSNTQLQAKMNQQAQLDAQSEIINKLKQALFDGEVMDVEVKQKQQEILDAAKDQANQQVEANVQLNKENEELKDENEKLQEVTGVADARFCHTARFLATTDTYEAALKLAELAVNDRGE